MILEKGVLKKVTKNDIKLLEENPEKFWEGIEVIGSLAFVDSGVKSLVLPKSVKRIEDRAFYGCKFLNSVVLPDSIKSISKFAFQWCWSLEKVLLPESIVQINDYAFAGCEKMTTLYIPDGVEYIGSNAFAHCHNLEKLTLPKSVKNTGGRLFFSCEKIKEVLVMGDTNFAKDAFDGMKNGAKLYISSFDTFQHTFKDSLKEVAGETELGL